MPVKNLEKTHREGIIFASATVLITGILGIIDKVGTVSSKSPFVFSTQSVFFAFIFTSVCYFFLYRKTMQKEIKSFTAISWIQVIIVGCFSSGIFILLRIVGLTQSTGTFATLSQAVTTSLTVILAHFFLRERLSKISWLIFIFILIAMYFMSVGSLSFASIKPGDMYILLGTVFLAVGNIFSRLAVKKNNPFFVTTGRFFFGFAFLFLISILFSFHAFTGSFNFFSVLSGLFWAANVIFFNFALHRIGASLTTSIIMIAPVVTMVLEVAFLSYHFTQTQYIAAFIIMLCGVVIAVRK